MQESKCKRREMLEPRGVCILHFASCIVLVLILCCSTVVVRAQQNIDFSRIELQTVKVSDGLYVLMGGPAQGNVAVSVGSDGVFLVDSMYGEMHQKIVDAVRRLTPQPIRYVVNTHLHGDH